jgi:hypothetical protein
MKNRAVNLFLYTFLNCIFLFHTFGCQQLKALRPRYFFPLVSPISLPLEPTYTNWRASSWDRTGKNADYVHIAPGETATLSQLKGPGEITHLWFTYAGEEYASRLVVLRIYWDGAALPAVEAPIGDFFLSAHGLNLDVESRPIVVTNRGAARNCYFKMPFKRSALLELHNEGLQPLMVYYHVDYHKTRRHAFPGFYFHAKYNQQFPTDGWIDLDKNPDQRAQADYLVNQQPNIRGHGNYTILDVRGTGYYVGCALGVHSRAVGWWGEGDDMIFIDDDTSPTIHGTGTEDYFNNAWGLQPYTAPLYGVPLYEAYVKGGQSCVYRFHLDDPIAFKRSIRVTIEHGHANSRSDDYSSVAYWYQTEPGDSFGYLGPARGRMNSRMLATMEHVSAVRRIYELERKGRLAQAVEVCEQRLREDPDADRADVIKFLLARLALRLGQAKRAKSLFTEIADHSDSRIRRQVAQDMLYLFESTNNALILINGDDIYDVYLDGVHIGSGTLFEGCKRFRVTLKPGRHTLAARCRNIILFGGLVAEVITLDSSMITDRAWMVTDKQIEDWEIHTDEMPSWRPATEYGTHYDHAAYSYQMNVIEWGGSSAQWIWDEQNYIDDRILYFKRDFIVNEAVWRNTVPFIRL